MNGLQNQDGTDSPRTDAVRKLAADPAPARLQQAYLARPRALLHYSRDTIRLHQYYGLRAPLEESLRGAHRLLVAAGYRVDFLDDAALASLNEPPNVPVVLARSDLLTPAHIAALTAHAGNGGTILAGHSTGMYDANGQLYGNPPSELLLGCTLGELVDYPGDTPTAFAPPHKFPVTHYRRLTPTTARPIAHLKPEPSTRRRHPAILRHNTVITVATDLFAWADTASDKDIEKALKLLGLTSNQRRRPRRNHG